MTYIKCAHGFTNLLSVLLFGRISDGYLKEKSYQKKMIQRYFSSLWNLFDTINIFFKFFITVVIPHRLGYNVIIEEGLNMSIANYEVFRPFFLGTKPTTLPFLSLLLRWVNSRKHLDVVIEANDSNLDRRRKSRSFRRTESEDLIKLQRRVCSQLRGPHVLVIDSSGKSIEEVHKIIIERLSKDKHFFPCSEMVLT
jgi:hypothetical protein